jgi:hypothetical protein
MNVARILPCAARTPSVDSHLNGTEVTMLHFWVIEVQRATGWEACPEDVCYTRWQARFLAKKWYGTSKTRIRKYAAVSR